MLPIMPNLSHLDHVEVAPVSGPMGNGSSFGDGIVKVTTAAACGIMEVSSAVPADTTVGPIAGVAGSAVITNPADVIKTRLQVTPYSEELTGRQLAKELIREEGYRGFFKGIGPRLLITGPKLALTMTLAQYLHQKVSTTATEDASVCVDLPEPDLGDSPNANP